MLLRKSTFYLAAAGIGATVIMVVRLHGQSPITAPPVDPSPKPYDVSVAASGILEALSDNVAIGVEQPYSDIQWFENGAWIVNPNTGIITTPNVGRNVQDVPDLTANIRYEGDYGHMQVAGVVRKLTFQPATGDSAIDRVGYGINLTGTLHPWACLQGVLLGPALLNSQALNAC